VGGAHPAPQLGDIAGRNEVDRDRLGLRHRQRGQGLDVQHRPAKERRMQTEGDDQSELHAAVSNPSARLLSSYLRPATPGPCSISSGPLTNVNFLKPPSRTALIPSDTRP